MPEDESNTSDPSVFLGRQPILGRDQQLLAYELLFRNGQIASGNQAEVLDPTHATATVITNTFTEFSVGDVLGNFRGFINVDYELLFSDLLEALPKGSVVLEILENIRPTPDVLERCRYLAEQGYTLAIDDVTVVDDHYMQLLELAEIIKVDLQPLDNAQLRALVARLKPLRKKLLAEKVETREQMQLCHELGFDLFQGYFFARPTIVTGKKLNPSQLALLRLMTLFMDDADTAEIEQAFKLETGLTVNLLRLTNSAASGLNTTVTSLRHAITLLGRRQLQRWIQLLLYTNPQGNQHSANPLLQLAATRGRLMELLAERREPRNRELLEQAFMVGIMSLMPTLLGIPMSDILSQLPVAPRVQRALIERDGTLGKLLTLVESTESDDPQDAQTALLTLPGLNAPILAACLTQAMNWANQLGQEGSR